MSDLDDSFAKLLGRQPNDKERQDLYRVRDALGLKSNDAIWLVLMALQHYQTQYEKIPMAVKAASTAALNDFATGAENALEGVKQQTISDLSVAVGKAAQKIAGDTASAQKWKWVSICMVSVTMIDSMLGTDRAIAQATTWPKMRLPQQPGRTLLREKWHTDLPREICKWLLGVMQRDGKSRTASASPMRLTTK
jgi:hypothetical protein